MDSIFDDYASTPPDHVNEQGIKWWRVSSIERYANTEDSFGTKLSLNAYVTEDFSGNKMYVLTDGKQVVACSESFEGIAVEIDMLKALERFGE